MSERADTDVAPADGHPAARAARPAARAGRPTGPPGGAAARALGSLALANARYWTSTAGQARAQLRYWRARARRIEDPRLRSIALAKLREEGFNAQAAAVLATIAPRAARPEVVRAIVALELLFDCLDGLSEQLGEDSLAEGERLFAPLLQSIEPGRPARTPSPKDYLGGLSACVREAIGWLPAAAAVAPTARECAWRAAQAQMRMHAAQALGHDRLGAWARAQAQLQGGALGWRERLAGAASSVLTLHALIAAAADPATSSDDAQRIDCAYMSLCAVVTLLDSVVDRERDAQAGELAYITLYEHPGALASSLASTAAQAVRDCAQLPSGGHHLMTLAGAIAYWCSHPAAAEPLAAATLAPLRHEQRALIAPPLTVMRAWRTVKRVKSLGRSVGTREREQEQEQAAPC